MLQSRLAPELCGIPGTMLWTLYERADEARRHNGLLRDPECQRIFESLDYDFEAHFGKPSGLAPARALMIDNTVRRWLARHPAGLVVSLGEGLETQALRVDNGRMQWLTVDLPEAIRVRERFLPPTARFRQLARSALELDWMQYVDDRSGVLVVAQGLLMYFDAERVRQLFVAIASRFTGAEMVFDLIPRSVSHATVQGKNITAIYTAPVMPWGLDRNEVAATLRSWWPGIKRISCRRYRMPSGRPEIVERVLDAVVPRRQKQPSVVHVTF
jgi:O-methyltransferase involved in polyketide biosynthesis